MISANGTSKNLLIEASAGTGKTYTLQKKFTEAILEGVPIDRILAVTFTNAATRELKRRLYNNLLLSLEEYRHDKDKYQKISTALLFFDEVQIFTLHKFAASMLSLFGFERGKFFENRRESSFWAKEKLLEQISLAFAKIIHEKTIHPLQMDFLLSAFKRNEEELITSIANFLSTNPKIAPIPSFEELSHTLEKMVSSLPLEHFEHDLSLICTSMNKFLTKDGSIQPAFQKQITALREGHILPLLEKGPFFPTILQPENCKKGQPFPHLQTLPLLHKIADHIDLIKNPYRVFLFLSQMILQSIQEEKMHHGIVDAFIENLFAMTQDENVRTCIEHRYDVVFIDEFQDTDRYQWEIFATLFAKKKRLFCVVGDPKQSIYAFRNADLHTYLFAKEKFEERLSLIVNYRSHPQLIQAVNTLFDENNTPGLFTFSSSPSLIHPTITAGATHESIGNEPAFEIVSFGEGKQSSTFHHFYQENKEELFHTITRLLMQQKQHGIPFSSCCILVKDRNQAKDVAKYLEQFCISSYIMSPVPLFETPAFHLIVSFIECLLFHYNVSKLKKFLLHPYLHLRHETLSGLFDVSYFFPLFTQLENCKIVYEKFGLSALFGHFWDFTITGFKESSLREIFSTTPAEYDEVQQMIEVCLEEELALSQLLEKLKKGKKHIHGSSYQKRPFLQHDPVIISTTHMSKGLEFDVVFCLGPSMRFQETITYAKNEDGFFDICKNEKEIKRQLEEKDQEKIRLLYVALTRAKRKCYWIVFFPDIEKTPFGSLSPTELLLRRFKRGFMSHSMTYEKTPMPPSIIQTLKEEGLSFVSLIEEARIHFDESAKSSYLFAPQSLDLTTKRQTFASFSSLYPQTTSLKKTLFNTDFFGGKEFGTLMHLVFEKIIEKSLYTPWNRDRIRVLLHSVFEKTKFEEHLHDIFSMIEWTFTAQLFGDYALTDIPPQCLYQEAEFAFIESDHQYIKGFADLVIFLPHAIHLVDWKTNYLEEYSPSSLYEEMQHHRYFEQAKLYTRALQKGVEQFFPHYCFNKDFQGAHYVFLRGLEKGHFYLPPKDLI